MVQAEQIQSFKIERPTIDDVSPIKRMIDFYVEKKLMLPRTEENIIENIRDFLIVRGPKNRLIGCIALQIWTESVAEIRSLAVDENHQGLGIGRGLIDWCLKDAKKIGIEEIFTLTYVDGFFKKFGFRDIDKQKLPHKVWNDCLICPNYLSCNEIALIKEVA